MMASGTETVDFTGGELRKNRDVTDDQMRPRPGMRQTAPARPRGREGEEPPRHLAGRECAARLLRPLCHPFCSRVTRF